MNKFLENKDKEHAYVDLDEIVSGFTHWHVLSHVWDHRIEDDDPEFAKRSIQKLCEGNQIVIMMAIFCMPTSPKINMYADDAHASYKELERLLNKQL